MFQSQCQSNSNVLFNTRPRHIATTLNPTLHQKRHRKHPKKALVPSDDLNSASDTDSIINKPKGTLCIAEEQPLAAQVPTAISVNDQAMDTTVPLPENEDEALKQEVYEILKRR